MPDQYGAPTEEEMRRLAYAPPQQAASYPERHNEVIAGQNVSYTGSREDAIRTMLRNDAGSASRDPTTYGALQAENGTPLTQEQADAYKNAYDQYQVDTRGKGKYGIRGWMHDHPVGTMAAFIAAAAGGAALSGGFAGGGAAAGGGGAGGAAGAGGGAAGGSAAGVGWGGAGTANSGLGAFGTTSAGSMAGVGGGNAGALAASGGIAGGAGLGAAGSAAGPGVVSFGGSASDYIKGGQSLAGLLGGGGGSGGNSGGQSMPYIPSGMLGSQMPPPQQQTRGGNLIVNNQPMQLPPAKPFGPKMFQGKLIWT